MKESAKLSIAFLGAGVASNLLLSSAVAGATSGFPMAAAGGEGALALGGAYGAWKLKGKRRLLAALVGGAAAGLLVDSVQSGRLSSAPVAPVGAKSTSTVGKPTSPKTSGQTSPTAQPSGLGQFGMDNSGPLPGFSNVGGGFNERALPAGTGGGGGGILGDVTAAELAGANSPPSGLFGTGFGPDWDPFSQSGAATRLGMRARTFR